ncbi:MAG: acyl-CoA thioesterase [Gammaproteobacteria bacterium]
MDEVFQPQGELVIQTIAMPANTNPYGDIFGGWLVSIMDLGASVLAHKCSHNRMATIAIDRMSFIKPVMVGDTVACYAEVTKRGNTSVTIGLEVWVQKRTDEARYKVTQGLFTFVAIDEQGKSTPIKWNPNV